MSLNQTDQASVIEATTLGDQLLRAAGRWPDNDAWVFPDARVTYGELARRAFERAKSLMALGIEAGDHVGILMPNCLEYVELIYGAVLAGAVAVPMNARYKARELAYVVENADLKTILVSDLNSEYADFVDLLGQAFPDLPGQQDAAHLSLKNAPVLRSAVMFGDSLPEGFMPQAAFEKLAAQIDDEAVHRRRIAVKISDPCIMMYTSGTTANPKGCPLSNENLVRNGISMNRTRYFLGPDDRMWDPLPMFHMSSTLPMVACTDAGAAMLCMNHFDAGQALKMIEEEKATVLFPAFPTLTIALINHPEFQTRDLSRVRRINNVAPVDVLKQFQNAFPQAVQTGAFGMTEVGGVISFNHPDESLEERLDACGQPFPGLEVKIIHPETGKELPADERGELIVKGYAVFSGYYKDPVKTAECLKDGWFHTGDLCSLSPNGAIRFHGRLKDMLKVGGENVAAIEIESYLMTHPAVKMAQVVGVPDDRLQEVPAAFIELKDGQSLTEDEVIAYCKGQIASWKVPRLARFVTDWPMSSTKIQKFKLREDLLAELGLSNAAE